jgi:hypothetical protein
MGMRTNGGDIKNSMKNWQKKENNTNLRRKKEGER